MKNFFEKKICTSPFDFCSSFAGSLCTASFRRNVFCGPECNLHAACFVLNDFQSLFLNVFWNVRHNEIQNSDCKRLFWCVCHSDCFLICFWFNTINNCARTICISNKIFQTDGFFRCFLGDMFLLGTTTSSIPACCQVLRYVHLLLLPWLNGLSVSYIHFYICLVLFHGDILPQGLVLFFRSLLSNDFQIVT